MPQGCRWPPRDSLHSIQGLPVTFPVPHHSPCSSKGGITVPIFHPGKQVSGTLSSLAGGRATKWWRWDSPESLPGYSTALMNADLEDKSRMISTAYKHGIAFTLPCQGDGTQSSVFPSSVCFRAFQSPNCCSSTSVLH